MIAWLKAAGDGAVTSAPYPGVGIGTSSILSGLPNSCTTAAFIVFAIVDLLLRIMLGFAVAIAVSSNQTASSVTPKPDAPPQPTPTR